MKTIKNYCGIPENYTGIVEHPNGTKAWFLNGKRHREDGPCTTCKDCLEGNFELCSKPGPAIEYPNGTKEWFLNGKRHRVDGPAVERSDGEKQWFLNEKLHRIDGPAIISNNGTKYWFLNGELHRTDGPAVEYLDGSKGYWLNNKSLDKNKINQFVKEFGYPIETAIKLVCFIGQRQINHEDNKSK